MYILIPHCSSSHTYGDQQSHPEGLSESHHLILSIHFVLSKRIGKQSRSFFSLFFDSFLLSPPFTSLYQAFHPYQKWDIGVSLTTVFQKKSQNRRFMILYFADMSGG